MERTIPDVSDGKVHFRTDPETGVMRFFTRAEDGVTEKTYPMPSIVREINELGKSEAEKRLAKLKAQKKSRVEVVEINGDNYLIKSLNYVDLIRFTATVGRLSNGSLSTDSQDAIEETIAAALHCCVVTSEDDDTPFFDIDLAREFATEPAAIGLVSQLFEEIVARNPDIVPPAEDGKKKARRRKTG